MSGAKEPPPAAKRYEWTADMREISGFGGGYEAACRAMVVAGLEWWDAHPKADPKFRSYRNVTGICTEDNDDASALSAAMVAVTQSEGGCTGAMHQYAVAHVIEARRMGWDVYAAKLRELKAKDSS